MVPNLRVSVHDAQKAKKQNKTVLVAFSPVTSAAYSWCGFGPCVQLV